jgi:hypothetical protein
MDDFNVSSLHESKNEWGSRLLTILTPLVIEGFRSIFDEAVLLCKNNDETDKYLMTFQNFISRIPKWNSSIIETERKRIIERSACHYLEDLVTCVHIIQLKLLTAIRVGQKQKKININIPKLDDFIHKIYVNVARRVYKNVYLFELGIPPLHVQKNYRELEILIQEGILNTVRDSIPVEAILQAYMDETVEEDVVEEIKEHVVEEKDLKPQEKEKEKTEIIGELSKEKQLETEPFQSLVSNNNSFNEDFIFPELPKENTKVTFDDLVSMKDFEKNMEERVPTVFEKKENNMFEYGSSTADDDDGGGKLQIHSDQPISLDSLDIHVIDPPEINLNDDLLLKDIEILA